jgi:hypothetical protein
VKLYSTVCLGLLVVFFCDDKQPKTVSDFCQQTKVIKLTAQEIDTLSRQSIDQILAHNQKWKRLCK